MPIALDTTETFDVVLRSDRGKNPAPAFVFRYLTSREFRAVAALGDDRDRLDGMGTEATLDELFAAIKLNLAGWRDLRRRDGTPIEYDPDLLEDVLCVAEAWELYYAARRYGRLSDDQKKTSESPSPGVTDASAPAPAEPAPTHPQSSSPPTSNAPAAEGEDAHRAET